MFLKRKKENEQVRNHNTNEWKQLLREISVNRSIPASYQEALRLFQVESFFTFSVCNKHSKPLET